MGIPTRDMCSPAHGALVAIAVMCFTSQFAIADANIITNNIKSGGIISDANIKNGTAKIIEDANVTEDEWVKSVQELQEPDASTDAPTNQTAFHAERRSGVSDYWELRAKTHGQSWLTRTSTQLAGGWKYYINLVHPNSATKASVTYSVTGDYTYATPMVTTFTKVAIEINYQPVTQVTLVVNDFAYASTAPAPTSDQDQHVAFGNATDCRQIWSPQTIIDLRGTPFAVKGGAAAFQSSGLPITGSFNCYHDDQYCVLQVIALPDIGSLYGSSAGTTWTPVLSIIDDKWYQDVLYATQNGWVEDTTKFIVDTKICLKHGADLFTHSECFFAIQALGLDNKSFRGITKIKDKNHRRKYPAGCSIRKKGDKMVAFFNRNPNVDQQKKHPNFQTVCGFPNEFCWMLGLFQQKLGIVHTSNC